MKRSESRILTTHVGSLVRPPAIVEAMIRRELGDPVDPGVYSGWLKNAVRDVVRQQAQVGIDVVDDGEFGKVAWTRYIGERLQGMGPFESPLSSELYPEQERYGDFYHEYRSLERTQWLPDCPSRDRYRGEMGSMMVACVGPVAYRPEAMARDIANFKAALEGVGVTEAFLPVVAPASAELIPNQHYQSQDDYLYALAEALAVEYRMIVDAGLLLQVDDAILPMQAFMQFRGRSGDEYKRWARSRVEALNHALRGIPPERVRYHICFGSQNIPHTSDPGLSDILDLILGVQAQGYLIESANPRHEHEWQVWEDVKLPEGKILIPGVVSHCTNVVEAPELVSMRILNFARLVGRENVIAGTDCGFSQFWNLVRVHSQVQWAKLEALVAGARLASERLWRKAG